MESFRTLIKGWLGKVLLVLFLTPLALVGIEGYFSGGNRADVARDVNGEPIAKKDVEKLTQQHRGQYLSLVGGDETLLNDAFIEKSALDFLTNNALLKQQSEKLGIQLSDAQIEQMLTQQPVFQENGQFSQKLFENYLRTNGLNRATLVANIRDSQAVQLLSSTVVETAFVSKTDVQQIMNLQTQQRHVHVARMDLTPFMQKITASAAQLKTHYDANQQAFTQPAQVDVQYVVLSAQDFQSNSVTVTDAELQAAYDQFVSAQQSNAERSVRHILITATDRTDAEAEKRAQEVYSKLKAGETFANLAQQYSEDDESKANGGALDGYETGIYSDEFDAAVLKLKANEYSAPVKTQFGYHIIAVDQLKQAAIPIFETEKPRLQAELQQTKTANFYTDSVNTLNELVISSDSLDVIAQEVKTAKVITTKGFGLITADPVLSQPVVKAKLFSKDVANGDRNASSAITLSNGDTLWFKVLNYHAQGVPPLVDIQDKVKAHYVKYQAAEKAKASLKEMMAAFKQQPASAVLAKHTGLNFVDQGVYARSQGLPAKIERAAFSVLKPKADHWSVATTTMANELIVVAVSEVIDGGVPVTDADQAEMKKLYEQARAQQELEDYTRYLNSQAKIK